MKKLDTLPIISIIANNNNRSQHLLFKNKIFISTIIIENIFKLYYNIDFIN